ncbi:MAG: hypothetical protein KC478_08035 [Bacteriovoracaceae bacterium]|nr:hypothetical protein [Bacteriovoracaceae bacterium]
MKAILTIFISFSALAGFLPKSFDAQFADVRGTKEIPVNIKYKFPKQISYEVKGDAPLLYVCNEEKTWKYTPPFMEGEKGELAVGDSGQFCYSRIFDSLSQGLENNKLYKTVKKKKKAFLTFNKDAKSQLGLEKIEIEFKEAIGAKTTLGEAQNLKLFLTNKAEPVLLKLVKFEKNPKLTKKHFQFETPKNTNITQMK